MHQPPTQEELAEAIQGFQQAQQAENNLEEIKNRYKSKHIAVNTATQVDITSVALQKYGELKKNYNFVSFEQADKKKSHPVGYLEPHAITNFDFNKEYISFQKNGYSVNPNTDLKGFVFNSSVLPDLQQKAEKLGEVIGEDHPDFIQRMYEKTSKKAKLQKTKEIKAKRDKTEGLKFSSPWEGYGENLVNGDLTEDQKQALVAAEQRRKIRIEEAKKEQERFEPYSTFHWKDYHDYKGRSYVDAPSDLKLQAGNCYIPKKLVHTWIGGNAEGYQVAKFFPKYGHFFISGNAEGHIKLFDVLRDKSCAMTYVGHTKAIRDIAFTNDGKHFLSASFDKTIHYWDTEYGKVHCTFKLKKYPFCVKFNPQFDKQNLFLAGSANKKISQFDINTGQRILQYDQHLGTVNTITFIEPRKFVTSSDDKKLFVWQFGIPVVYKHVSEPEMHAVTSAVMHPNGEYYAGQSSDNQIVIYEAKGGNFRRNRAKKFASHYCAGYACGISFSNDGQFLASGDERGRLFFYDWKTAKNYRTLDAHANVCIGVEWHPNDPTKVLTCGWEGLIKLWE